MGTVLANVVNIIFYATLIIFGIRNLLIPFYKLSFGGKIFRIIFFVIMIPSVITLITWLFLKAVVYGAFGIVIIAILIVMMFAKGGH